MLPTISNIKPDPPDFITIGEFWASERYGRQPFARSRNPFTCGVTGKTYSNAEVRRRIGLLARGLGARLAWKLGGGATGWERVVAVYSFNSIDYIPINFAIHRLGGIVTTANAQYNVDELVHQLRTSGARAIVTCRPLLANALQAAKAVGISSSHVFLMEVSLPDPSREIGGKAEDTAKSFSTLDELITEGETLPELEPLRWCKGQGARQVAYLCFSSGTSGLPKAVMISHHNVISNIMQLRWHESVGRGEKGIETQVTLGLLPQSHIYGLVVLSHVAAYRGDEIVLLPRFELAGLLRSIERFRINFLGLVPPIVIQILRNLHLCAQYDLSSVRAIYSGAAPLGAETHEEILCAFPGVTAGQGYGLTESCTAVLGTGENDIMIGTSGSVLPGVRVRLVDPDTGSEVHAEEVPGEVWLQSPSVTLGYLSNAKATEETYVWDEMGRWLRTGDLAIMRKSGKGHEHFAIVDRLKELIKVKGHQVAPAELEAHLLMHPHVADCAVISFPDKAAGEVPKAFVVLKSSAADLPPAKLTRDIMKYVEDHKARYKWLKGGVELVDEIPKSPSGKILRRLLRERSRQKTVGAKL